MGHEQDLQTLQARLDRLQRLAADQMKNDEEYRRQAADAQREADNARNEDDCAAWLRVAQGWLSLIRRRPQSEEDFDARSRTVGTGQLNSGAKN
jgi:hypothetical protein